MGLWRCARAQTRIRRAWTRESASTKLKRSGQLQEMGVALHTCLVETCRKLRDFARAKRIHAYVARDPALSAHKSENLGLRKGVVREQRRWCVSGAVGAGAVRAVSAPDATSRCCWRSCSGRGAP